MTLAEIVTVALDFLVTKGGRRQWGTSNQDGCRIRVRYRAFKDGWKLRVWIQDYPELGEASSAVAITIMHPSGRPETLELWRYPNGEWTVRIIAEGWLSLNASHPACVVMKEMGDKLNVWQSLRSTQSDDPSTRRYNHLVADVFNPQPAGTTAT